MFNSYLGFQFFICPFFKYPLIGGYQKLQNY